MLTAYNGVTRTHDEIGNLLSDGTWTYTWQHGRELASMSSGTTTWSYTYDGNGMRISRTNGTKTYNYVYNGSQLVQMSVGSDTLYFTYGLLGPTTVTWNGTTYYYALNGQGDVIGIFDEDGNPVVAYNWDNAWGYNPLPSGVLADTIGTLNPLRYRGYVYDTETGLYYLQSRYYNPEIGRFINADGFTSTGQGLLGNNMFAYCGNSPVGRKDNGGEFWDTVFDVISLAASVVEVCINPNDTWAWVGLAGDVVDLIPFVTCVGEVTRVVKTVDKVADTVQIAKAVDFTDDAADLVKTLDRSSGYTKSTASAGRKIHAGYKIGDGFNPKFKEARKIPGVRPDYIDIDNNIIYELKPMNPRGVRSGIRQLQRYNKAYGGGFTLRLELY